MKFSYPDIENVFDTDSDFINTVIIENKALFCKIVSDIHSQICGFKGKAVLAESEDLLDFSKFADLTSSFIPFELNGKSLMSKIISAMEREAQEAERYEETVRILADIENYIDKLAVDFPCDLLYNKLNVSSLLKAVGVEIIDDSEGIAERMLNYMELVREFDRDKLFITVNMRAFVDDISVSDFMKTALLHKFHCIMLESTSFKRLIFEKRYTVDEDLCEF